MRKIPSLFQRNYDGDRLVRDEVVPGSEWVIEGEGVATVKWDGTPVLVRGDRLFKRFDFKPERTPPPGFEMSGEPDPVTGRVQGWVPVGDGPEDRWYREGYATSVHAAGPLEDGTYELVGPKVQGNPYRFATHFFLKHGDAPFFFDPPRDFEGLKDFLSGEAIEGIVWHHSDGRMVKIKAKDFGIKWPSP